MRPGLRRVAAPCCSVLLPPALLAAWAFAAPYTCLAAAAPALVLAALAAGAFLPALDYRRYRARYFLRDGGWPLRLASGALPTLVRCVAAALVYTFGLAAFSAAAGGAEWTALVFCGVATVLARDPATRAAQRLAAGPARGLVARRLAAWAGFAAAVPVYVLLLLNSPLPDFLDPGSLARSLENATAAAGSRCGWLDRPLRLARELEAAQWHLMIHGSLRFDAAWARAAGWVLFLAWSGLALMGMSRLSAEVADFLCRPQRGPTHAAG